MTEQPLSTSPRLTFVMTYCSADEHLVELSVGALHRLYPQATIIALFDEGNLKRNAKSGEWTQRMFQRALETDADIIVKIDPDTRAFAPVSDWPREDVFGQMSPDWVYRGCGVHNVIFGACIGFQRAALQKILDSGYLLDRSYVWKGDSTQDPIVAEAIRRLNLSVGHLPNLRIKTRWEKLGDFDQKGVTFAHPVR
jgi:hypothetical protein